MLRAANLTVRGRMHSISHGYAEMLTDVDA